MEFTPIFHEYGMAALGLVMFLLVWKVAVEPSLRVLKEVVERQSEQDKTQQATVAILNEIVQRLERIEKRTEEWTTAVKTPCAEFTTK